MVVGTDNAQHVGDGVPPINGPLVKDCPLQPASARALRVPRVSYVDALFKAFSEGLWSPKQPDGHLVLTVAENRRCAPAVRDRLAAAASTCLPLDSLYYGDMTGCSRLKQVLARYTRRVVLGVNDSDSISGPGSSATTIGGVIPIANGSSSSCPAAADNPFKSAASPASATDAARAATVGGATAAGSSSATAAAALAAGSTSATAAAAAATGTSSPSTAAATTAAAAAAAAERWAVECNIYALTGVAALLDLLTFVVSDPGDTMLVPAPYYPVFDVDLVARNDVRIQPVHAGPGTLTPEVLDAAVAEAARSGSRVRALLLTHPSNPLGTLYSEEQLRGLLDWCLRKRVHLISDEIYAKSVYGQGAHFVSALVAAAGLVHESPDMEPLARDYVHAIFGLSKDLCGSGLRVGWLVSSSSAVSSTLPSFPFSTIPFPMQHMVAEILDDDAWVDKTLDACRGELRDAYGVVAGMLDRLGVPYQAAEAGMFVWMDLRAWMEEQTWQAEGQLFERAVQEQRMVLTPGNSCHAAEPGWFRICFAYVGPEALQELERRMRLLLQAPDPAQPSN